MHICAECGCSNDDINQEKMNICYQKITVLIDDERVLNAKIVEAKVKCDNFQAKYRSIVGTREKQLINALEFIEVVRQAYHGNVLVGNHCITVLRKYSFLSSVINDQPVRENFDEIFSLMAQIIILVMARRFLAPEECCKLQKLCESFGEKFQSIFPKEILRERYMN